MDVPGRTWQRMTEEDEAIRQARSRASGEVPAPEVGALLAWLATTVQARAAVEVGACSGVTGLWLARGLADRGVLTSVEPDAYVHGLAGEAFAAAGEAGRVRAIEGDAGTVLPRLSDAGYDLVLLQGEPGDYPDHLGHARRLLRAGGVLVARRVRAGGPGSAALERFLELLAEDVEGFTGTVLDLDDGLVLATRREAAPDPT